MVLVGGFYRDSLLSFSTGGEKGMWPLSINRGVSFCKAAEGDLRMVSTYCCGVMIACVLIYLCDFLELDTDEACLILEFLLFYCCF